jgi:hypothetical protein
MADKLDNLQVAAPCPADWQKMKGDAKVRFCESCKLNVYNISEMTQAEAEQFITNKEGRVCVRLYKRKDGTIITSNCPVGLRLIKRKLEWVTAGVAAILAALGITWFEGSCVQGQVEQHERKAEFIEKLNRPNR